MYSGYTYLVWTLIVTPVILVEVFMGLLSPSRHTLGYYLS